MSSHMEIPISSNNILNLADSFGEEMKKIMNILKLMSISSLVMLTVALGISVYLVYHPLFMNLLSTYSEIRFTLSILTVLILAIFSICIINAVRQYKFISSWNKKYRVFLLRRNELDKKIATDFTHFEQRE